MIFPKITKGESALKKRILFAAVSAAVCILTLFVSAFSASATHAAPDHYYDFTHTGSESNVHLDTVEIAKEYLDRAGEQLSESERAFLAAFGKLRISYSDLIATDKVHLEYRGGSMHVTAQRYSYTAAEGELVFLPTSLEYNGGTYPISEGSAVIEMSEDEAQRFTCSVIYEAGIQMLATDIGITLNLYHDTAKYAFECAEYVTLQQLYKEYKIAKRVYDEAYARYTAYLEVLERYNLEKQAYEDYLAALEKYNSDYSDYLAYLAAAEKYQTAEADYAKYLSDMETVRHQLAAIDLLKVKMTDGRSVYSAVMGGTVDEVLNNESVITGMLGVDATVVHRAGAATERVRALMTGYFSIEGEVEKYNYYAVNYENFRDSIRELTITLDKLYRYPRVRGTLIAEGKDKKYIILVAQLALVSNALTDGEIKNYDGAVSYGSTWTIENKTCAQILGTGYYVDTDSAYPLDSGYPTKVEEPVAPLPVEMPTLPKEPTIPIEPEAVEDPGEEPVRVDEPELPIPANAIVEDIYAELSLDERAKLAAEYREGGVLHREFSGEVFLFYINTAVERTYSAQSVEVTFHNEDGTKIYSTVIEENGALAFEGVAPGKADDEFGRYMFIGWKDEEGKHVSLSSIDRSIDLYPDFDRAPTYYNVTWCVDGRTVTERVISDTYPTCPISTDKADDLTYYYVFAGWDKPVEVLSCDVTYTAVYDKFYTVTHSDGGATLQDNGETVTVDAYESRNGEVDISRLLPKIYGERDLVIMTRFGSVRFSFTDVMKMYSLGVCVVTVDVYQNGISECRYSVSFRNSVAEPVGGNEIKVNARLLCSLEHALLARLSYLDGEALKYVAFAIAGNEMAAELSCNTLYSLVLEYRISVLENEGATLSTDKAVARPGELVTIFVTPTDEKYAMTDLIVLDESGNRLPTDKNGAFRMPYGNVTVMQKAELKYYTVTFVAAGKVIATYKVLHGTAPTPPTPTVIENDNLYSYSFTRWYPYVRQVKADTTYTAVYDRTLLPVVPQDDGLKVTPGVMRLLVLGGVACGLLAVGVIPSAVIFAVRLRKRRKMTVGR